MSYVTMNWQHLYKNPLPAVVRDRTLASGQARESVQVFRNNVESHRKDARPCVSTTINDLQAMITVRIKAKLIFG